MGDVELLKGIYFWPNSLYCFFEAVGIGFETRSLEDIGPWLVANTAMIDQLTFSAVLAATLIANARVTISAMLRGDAPIYVRVGFVVSICASLLPLVMFAGRQFSDERQGPLYKMALLSFHFLWIIIGGIIAAGHSRRQVVVRESSISFGTSGWRGSGDYIEDDAVIGQEAHVVTSGI